jgi:uncharacterized LabA/DUF88 family protein
MTIATLFVDLPNFYSRLLNSGIETPRFLRDYFLYRLDFDLLANELTGSSSSIWIFYSGKRIGPSSERIEGDYLNNYINRVNSLKGVTAYDVNIPGEQREFLTSRCKNCGHENLVESKSEKGIDASLTVHLFDTMDSWDVAYLLSGDADFVPVVASLRRRGKIIIGAGFPGASPALVRECYDYIDLGEVFLKRDVAIYSILQGLQSARDKGETLNLSKMNLSRANLRGANLSQVNLSQANLRGANLCRANLHKADLSGADLINANLIKANLSGANLEEAYLNGADLSEANLSEAYLMDTKHNKRTKLPEEFTNDEYVMSMMHYLGNSH